MKKIITLLLAVVMVFNLTGCGKTEAEKIADSYSTLETSDHVFKLLDLEDIDAMAEQEGKMIVYFGSPICPSCVQLVPELDRLAKVSGVETVYYVYLEYTSDTAQEFAETGKYDYVGTPLVVLFEDGEYSYSNFSYRNPDSIYYDEDSNYYKQIVRMFENY
jgi:thiol-disulfide isomerase/thioredoxin